MNRRLCTYLFSFVGMNEGQLYDDTMQHLGAELGEDVMLVLRDAAHFSRGEVFCLPAIHFASQLVKLLKGVDVVQREVEVIKPTGAA